MEVLVVQHHVYSHNLDEMTDQILLGRNLPKRHMQSTYMYDNVRRKMLLLAMVMACAHAKGYNRTLFQLYRGVYAR